MVVMRVKGVVGTVWTHLYDIVCGDARFLFFAVAVVMIVPNVALCVTECMLLPVAFCNIVLPASAYLLLLTFCRNPGKTLWMMFPFVFLAAFQLVLLHLFGGGIIAVDMFLNVLTTNPGEAFELLDNIAIGVTCVLIIYVPLLLWGLVLIRKGILISPSFLCRWRRRAVKCFGCALPLTAVCYSCVPAFSMTTDIFPVNVCYNLYLAVKRSYATAHYKETSASFRFDAVSTHVSDCREICVLVIGETARACNFGLYGYHRDTTPLLGKTRGLTVFTDAYTQSNTTHKSVPMLLSTVTAEDYDSIYSRKSVIMAFREAGWRTAFYSNQRRNHSFIDFFGMEADTCVFIREDKATVKNPTDSELLKYVSSELSAHSSNTFIVLHTYGSHFKYNERYGSDDAVFTPDDDMSAEVENRERLVNAYDNTIRQTDRMLSGLIRILAGCGARVAMIYTSDHGEDLFDDGRDSFLHSSPVPSRYQLNVPLLVWLSSDYATAYPDVADNLRNNSHIPVATTVSVFHSLLGLAGISSPYSCDSLSVVSDSYTHGTRYFLTDRNRPVRLDDTGLMYDEKRKSLKFRCLW